MKKLLILFTLFFATQNLSADANLTTVQKSAVMSVVINYLLSDSTTTIPPIITSENNVMVLENQTDAIILQATGQGNMTYSISGGDSAFFSIDANTGVVTFIAAPNYESGKVEYSFLATFTDSKDNEITQEITINITDLTNPFQIAEIQKNGISINTLFGSSVSISGDYTVVGADRDDSTEGAVYLYKKQSNDTLLQIAKLKASDAQGGDRFGVSVAIDGDTIVVGANRDEANTGSAYVFKINSDNNVSQIAHIQASDAAIDAGFGRSVSISDTYIVVGASSTDTGSAYLFEIVSDSSVTQVAKIQASNASSGDKFGNSVDIDGNHIVVSALNDDITGTNEGSVYVFKINADSSVSQIANIYADVMTDNDYFGNSVSISDDIIVVGMQGNDAQGTNARSAYVFKIVSDTNVSQIAQLFASNPSASDNFGISVAIDGAYIIVGADREDTIAGDAGSAYIFNVDTDYNVTQIVQIFGHGTESDDAFGTAVAIDDRYFVAGSSNFDNEREGVYFFDLEAKGSYIYNVPSSVISHSEAHTNTAVYTLEGASSSASSITYTLSGDDASSFTMDENILYFNDVEDYENPSNLSNTYDLSISTTDVDGITRNIDVDVALEDRHYLFLDNLVADDAVLNDKLGESIAVSGAYTVVGAININASAGAVYVYEKQSDGGMVQIAKLEAYDAKASDNFGNSVAIYGDYIVVGAHTEGASSKGSVYVFKINSSASITQIAKIQSDDISGSDAFGRSVSISAEYIAIGATGQDTNGSNAGSVYLFKVVDDTNITQIAKIQSDDIEAGDSFGQSVSMSAEYITVGAYSEDGNGQAEGSAYVFKIISDTNVTQIAKLTASDAQDYDLFGYSVSMSGDNIVVGAYREDTGGNSAGSAYVFKRYLDTNVTQIAKIQASDTERNDNFAISVAISDTTIVVGAYGEGTGVINAGSAYIFEIISDTNVTQLDKLQASDPQEEDRFGNAVAIDILSNTITIGALQDDTTINNAGSVYVFTKDLNQP